MKKMKNNVGPAEGPGTLGASPATEPDKRIIESGMFCTTRGTAKVLELSIYTLFQGVRNTSLNAS